MIDLGANKQERDLPHTGVVFLVRGVVEDSNEPFVEVEEGVQVCGIEKEKDRIELVDLVAGKNMQKLALFRFACEIPELHLELF